MGMVPVRGAWRAGRRLPAVPDHTRLWRHQHPCIAAPSVVHRCTVPPSLSCACACAGNLLGLLLSPLILQAYGWRALFYAFGLLGAPLLAFWLAAVPRAPQAPQAAAAGRQEQAAVQQEQETAAAGAAPQSVDIADLLRSKAVWAIIVVNFVNHWGGLRGWAACGARAAPPWPPHQPPLPPASRLRSHT